MDVFITQKNITGLLSCVFKGYTEKIHPEIISEGNLQLAMDYKITEVLPDEKNAKRVLDALVKYAGQNCVYLIRTALKHYSSTTLTVCYRYVCKILDKRADVSLMLSDADVIAFNDLVRQVHNEAERYRGMLRFIETAQGILYAFYEPENDITDVITPHFERRLGSLPFIIHDLKRGKIALHNGVVTRYVNYGGQLYIELSSDENAITRLWQKYFDTVAIKERTNPRLQNHWLPKKLRKHLPEFKKRPDKY